MKEGNRKEIIENKREKRERKEDRVRERKLEKDLEKKKKKKKISRGERRGLTGHCGQTPWRATSPSAQTFTKTYPPLSDLGR